MQGRVKFYDDQRGYGFIKPDDGSDDVFVHIRRVVYPPRCLELRQDQKVEFEIQPSRNGKTEATGVRVLS